MDDPPHAEQSAGDIGGVGAPGVDCVGPPWILGWRGAPLEAPENTLVSFQRALSSGLDGLHYDLRASVGGDPVVLADAGLERTTDGDGLLCERSLTELFQLDAGGWFSKRFTGEPLPHLDEVLVLEETAGEPPLHLIELHEPHIAAELAARLRRVRLPHRLRIASTRRQVCLELRDAGLGTVLVCPRATEDELAFLRDERLDGLGVTTPRGWDTPAARQSWPCERWALGIGEPEDLYRALGAGVHAVTTTEGRRALAVRALLRLEERAGGGYPLEAEALPVLSSSDGPTRGEWRGEWSPRLRVRNPMPFACRVTVQLYVRRGAFECEGLPVQRELDVGEEDSLHFALNGGSWSPGGDPLLAALYEWEAAPGRTAGRLLLDLPLRRRRYAVADVITQRLEMLRESPGEARATMTLTRRRAELIVAVENPGGLREPRVIARLDGRTHRGASRLRLRLPADFDELEAGVSFSCGFYGRQDQGASERLRRWGGGLPADPGQGGEGRLLARRRG
jgi:glycerophosphoryl diester phosphodiesterase